jgi:hypothetical protein
LSIRFLLLFLFSDAVAIEDKPPDQRYTKDDQEQSIYPV